MRFLVLYTSLMAICAELLLGALLGVKAWSHMVYVTMSFALLGYGVGSNLFMLLERRLAAARPALVAGVLLGAIGLSTLVCSQMIPGMKVGFTLVRNLTVGAFVQLAQAYLLVALPFVGVGFLLSYAFSLPGQSTGRLYFWDMMGAALAAFTYLVSISWRGPQQLLALLSAAALAISGGCLWRLEPRPRATPVVLLAALAAGAFVFFPDSTFTVVDELSWEYFPSWLKPDEYSVAFTEWHPIGRTELYDIQSLQAQNALRNANLGTFEINVSPPPPFRYFATNYRSGTPVFALSEDMKRRFHWQVRPFSQVMELPYLFLEKPRVVIIGAGGGRDIFVARTHGAASVVGAEINPATHRAMSAGGEAYEFSGRLYDEGGTRIERCDGRHLVRTLDSKSADLIVLNGVDTFSALQSGAYAFAETYLYTREAISDYLRLLDDRGILNVNRLYLDSMPGETMRMISMIFEELRRMGHPRPWEHVMVAFEKPCWGCIVVRKEPFTLAEVKRMLEYTTARGSEMIYAPGLTRTPPSPVENLASAFSRGAEAQFSRDFPHDISVVTNDRPFFYHDSKKFLEKERWADQPHQAGGYGPALVQLAILVQTVLFIAAFLFIPLVFFRGPEAAGALPAARASFVLYFAGIGFGYVLIELALMQRFILILGSPLYSVSVTLGPMLAFTGIGSACQARLLGRCRSPARLIVPAALVVAGYVALLTTAGGHLLEAAMGQSMGLRVCLVWALLAPIGFTLGLFFPTGLDLVRPVSPAAVAWAMAVNSGFTVLGSVISLMVAQEHGFTTTLFLAVASYAVAAAAFVRLAASSPGQRTDPAAVEPGTGPA